MTTFSVGLNSGGTHFEIKGDLSVLMGNSRIKLYLQSLKYEAVGVDLLLIPAAGQQVEDLYKKLEQLFARFEHKIARSAELEKKLDQYLREESEFALFSAKARDIWANKIETDDFRAFANTVSKAMPHRGLYPLQLLSAFHMGFAQNACNFSVPGAGKTSVVLAAFAYLNSLPPDHPKYVNKIIVVGPLSSFGPWEEEFRECFGRPARAVRLSSGTPSGVRDRHLYSALGVDETAELILMSYQSVSRILDGLEHFLKRPGHNVLMVLDEAHRIKKTDEGVWAEAVLSLAPFCRSRIVLTGTPVPNGYQDLFNLFRFIWPNKNITGYRIHQLADMSVSRTDDRIQNLVKNIAPFFVRITKSQLGIPAATENPPISVVMGPRQREIYDFIEKSYMGFFQQLSNPQQSVRDLFARARLIRLMQAATDPALLNSPIEENFGEMGAGPNLFVDDAGIIEKIKSYPKAEIPQKYVEGARLVREILSRNPSEKVVVWCSFVQTLFSFKDYLEKHGIPAKVLYGKTPIDGDEDATEVDTRESIIREFHRSDSSYRVIIANPMAVGESISLHRACHTAIYLERNFNAGTFLQSKDRIHRYGLKPGDSTNYYYAVSTSSIDETIHRRLLQKEQVMLGLIESQPIPLINMNAEFEDESDNDVKAIIRDYVARSRKD